MNHRDPIDDVIRLTEILTEARLALQKLPRIEHDRSKCGADNDNDPDAQVNCKCQADAQNAKRREVLEILGKARPKDR